MPPCFDSAYEFSRDSGKTLQRKRNKNLFRVLEWTGLQVNGYLSSNFNNDSINRVSYAKSQSSSSGRDGPKSYCQKYYNARDHKNRVPVSQYGDKLKEGLK